MIQVPTVRACREARCLVARGSSCSHAHTVGLLGTRLVQLPGDTSPVSAHTSAEDTRKEDVLPAGTHESLGRAAGEATWRFPQVGVGTVRPDPCSSPDFLQLPLLWAESQTLPAPSQEAVPLPCTASGGKSCFPLACECVAPSPHRILAPLALLSFPLLHTQSLSGLRPPLLFPKGVKAADRAEG